jgi:hypothetical protein
MIDPRFFLKNPLRNFQSSVCANVRRPSVIRGQFLDLIDNQYVSRDVGVRRQLQPVGFLQQREAAAKGLDSGNSFWLHQWLRSVTNVFFLYPPHSRPRPGPRQGIAHLRPFVRFLQASFTEASILAHTQPFAQ